MALPKKSLAIVNPTAAGGRVAKRWSKIDHLLRKRLSFVDTRFTQRRGHATDLTQQALREGYDLVIAVGGDGTVNEIVNGFFRDGRLVNPGARLGFIPIGTGGDFRRTLQVPLDAEQAVEVIAQDQPLEIDVGRARFTGYDGAPVERYFVNVLGLGMGGDVSVRAKSFPRWFGGKTAFLGATLLVFLNYRGKRVRLTLDGAEHPDEFVITNIAIGNGRYQGGGMHPCPRAVLNDGLLEVTTIDRLSMFELLRDLPVLYSDDVYKHPKVRHFRAQRIRAASADITRIEVDGEALGTLPLEIEVLPKQLNILVPADSPLRSG
ncbi:MAG: diacylglycerol kinase family protein [Bryobacterales bacterium]